MFLSKVQSDVGKDYTYEQLREYVWNHLKSGQVEMIPLIIATYSFCSSHPSLPKKYDLIAI